MSIAPLAERRSSYELAMPIAHTMGIGKHSPGLSRQDRAGQFQITACLQGRVLVAESLQLRFEIRAADGAVAGDETAGVILHRANELVVAAAGDVGRRGSGSGGNEIAQQVVVVVVAVTRHGGGERQGDQREGDSGVAETHGDSLVCAFPSDCGP